MEMIRTKFSRSQIERIQDIHQICLAVKARHDAYIDKERAYTVIGAAIFYGPKKKSVQCQGRSLSSIKIGEEVHDHVYSRNRSGKYFCENDLSDFDKFFEWYWTKASIYVVVTKKENQLLREFQMSNYDAPWQTTYAKAGIAFAGS
jgi:hypothetical protein